MVLAGISKHVLIAGKMDGTYSIYVNIWIGLYRACLSEHFATDDQNV